MNIKNRLRKIKLQIPPVINQIVWDFANTTDEQLYLLRDLKRSGDESGAQEYTRQLIDQGFLSYRTAGRRV